MKPSYDWLNELRAELAVSQNFVVTDHIRVRGDANYALWPYGLMAWANIRHKSVELYR